LTGRLTDGIFQPAIPGIVGVIAMDSVPMECSTQALAHRFHTEAFFSDFHPTNKK
jgi:hypothetical protein